MKPATAPLVPRDMNSARIGGYREPEVHGRVQLGTMNFAVHRTNVIVLFLAGLVLACWGGTAGFDQIAVVGRPDEPAGFVEDLTAAAIERTNHDVR